MLQVHSLVGQVDISLERIREELHVESHGPPDAILQALYDVISVPAGQELTACRINDCSGQI